MIGLVVRGVRLWCLVVKSSERRLAQVERGSGGREMVEIGGRWQIGRGCGIVGVREVCNLNMHGGS